MEEKCEKSKLSEQQGPIIGDPQVKKQFLQFCGQGIPSI